MVVRHFPLERSHSLLVDKDFILAVNGTRVFDVDSGVALMKFKEITSLIRKTDEGADLVLVFACIISKRPSSSCSLHVRQYQCHRG